MLEGEHSLATQSIDLYISRLDDNGDQLRPRLIREQIVFDGIWQNDFAFRL